MKTQSAVLTTSLIVIALGLSGCGTSEDKHSDNDYSVLSALSEIPADDLFSDPIEQRTINTGDLREATRVADLTRPDDLESPEFAPWINALTGFPSDDASSPIFVPVADVLGLRTFELETAIDDEVGWSLLDIDAYVEQSSGSQIFSVIRGENLESFEGIRSNERPQFVASTDHRFAISRAEEPVNLWASGLESSLADDERFASIASALDDADAIAATIIQSGRSWEIWLGGQRPIADDPTVFDDLASHLPSDGGPILGGGWSVSSDGEPVTTIAYYLGTDEAAEAALPILESHYNGEQSASAEIADFVTLTETRSDGPVAIVTVTPAEGQPAGIVAMLLGQYRSVLPFA